MKIQNIFYTIGVIFIIIAVIYFTREYIRALPSEIKVILLIFGTVVAFVVAELLRFKDI